MGKAFLIALGLLVLVVAGGIGYLAASNLPPPSGRIVHAIPASRLPQ
jgi:hypothetical protein